jgi:hypothetical protein
MSTFDGDSPYLAAVSEVAATTTPAPNHPGALRLGSLRSFVSRLLVFSSDEREPAHPTEIQPGRNVTDESSFAPPTTSRTGETR